eukprot:Amastigsp_a676848_41.p5 type:complete len:126 gc:universal Amastigsp_a676848_41:3076-2699(-)
MASIGALLAWAADLGAMSITTSLPGFLRIAGSFLSASRELLNVRLRSNRTGGMEPVSAAKVVHSTVTNSETCSSRWRPTSSTMSRSGAFMRTTTAVSRSGEHKISTMLAIGIADFLIVSLTGSYL